MAGPEWGGFEENIQVMASRLRLPAAPGPTNVLSVLETLPQSLESLPFTTLSLLWVFVHTKGNGTSADLEVQTGTPARGPQVSGPVHSCFRDKLGGRSRSGVAGEWAGFTGTG